MERGERTWWNGTPATVVGFRGGRVVLRLAGGGSVTASQLDGRLGARSEGDVARQQENLARLAEAVLARLNN